MTLIEARELADKVWNNVHTVYQSQPGWFKVMFDLADGENELDHIMVSVQEAVLRLFADAQDK